MIFSRRLQDAIRIAIDAHAGQKRKGTDVPYITHLLSVALILSRAGADEDVIIAGILHDAIEDTNGAVKRENISRVFGERVAGLVNDVTEQDKSLPWEVRKQQALDHISSMDQDALLLKSADVLHNLKELVLDVEEQGEGVFAKFNAPKDKQLDRYQKLADALRSAWKDNPLLPEIEEGVSGLSERL